MSNPITDFHITSITKAMHLITWRRLSHALAFAILIGIGVISWLAAVNFLSYKDNQILGIRLLTVTPATYNSIADFNKKRADVVAVQITTLNFERNIRVETVSNIDNPIVQSLYDTFIRTLVYHPPIFTTDNINNNRLIKIANGAFVCNPYTDSIAYKYAPAAGEVIKVVCAVAIPPYNNDISGLMTFYLNAEPTPEQKSELFTFARDTSIQIYIDSNHAHKKLTGVE